MSARDEGFTLMEMLAVLAIISVLALLALPSYSDRIVRDQIKQAIALADIVKAPVAAAWSTTQSLPEDNASAGLPVAEKIVSNFVSAVAVRNGAIDIVFGNNVNGLIAGKVLTLRPAVVEDAPIVPMAWICGNANGPGAMTVKGENRTNIAARYLPVECRAIAQ